MAPFKLRAFGWALHYKWSIIFQFNRGLWKNWTSSAAILIHISFHIHHSKNSIKQSFSGLSLPALIILLSTSHFPITPYSGGWWKGEITEWYWSTYASTIFQLYWRHSPGTSVNRLHWSQKLNPGIFLRHSTTFEKENGLTSEGKVQFGYTIILWREAH